MKKTLFWGLLIALFCQCSYVIDDYKQTKTAKFIQINAELSNNVGNTYVELLNTSADITTAAFIPYSKAKVTIMDNLGKKTTLMESVGGFYRPESSFKGEVGKSYTLRIETIEGGIYESTAETLNAVPAIDSLYDVFDESASFTGDNPLRYGYTVYLDFKDSPKENEYYQWTTTHYSEAIYCKTCYNGAWDGFQCVRDNSPNTASTTYKCAQKCFDIEPNPDLILLNDRLINGNSVKRKNLVRVPFGDLSRYYVLIEQRSLTEKAFNYYNSLKQEARSSGTVFDVPAITRFSPNIRSLSNPDEKIIGLWNVFSSIQKPLIIERNKVSIPDYKPPVFIFSGTVDRFIFLPCEESPYRTSITPPGWK